METSAITILYDELGRPTVRRTVSPDLLADFLETDIGRSPAMADSLLLRLSGPDDFEQVGDLYALTRSGGTVTISNLFDEEAPVLAVPAAQVAAAARVWRDAVSVDGSGGVGPGDRGGRGSAGV